MNNLYIIEIVDYIFKDLPKLKELNFNTGISKYTLFDILTYISDIKDTFTCKDIHEYTSLTKETISIYLKILVFYNIIINTIVANKKHFYKLNVNLIKTCSLEEHYIKSIVISKTSVDIVSLIDQVHSTITNNTVSNTSKSDIYKILMFIHSLNFKAFTNNDILNTLSNSYRCKVANTIITLEKNKVIQRLPLMKNYSKVYVQCKPIVNVDININAVYGNMKEDNVLSTIEINELINILYDYIRSREKIKRKFSVSKQNILNVLRLIDSFNFRSFIRRDLEKDIIFHSSAMTNLLLALRENNFLVVNKLSLSCYEYRQNINITGI